MQATVSSRSPGAAQTVRALMDWSVAQTMPGQASAPADLDGAVSQWIPAPVPGTVAQALEAAGRWHAGQPQDFDASDWWYRCHFTSDPASAGARLRFKGLATLAQVWLNGQPVLTADNMFIEYRVDVSGRLQPRNELVICFRSLTTALERRRPRPRWKTRVVSHQQLRWFRTTLLGRIPGWSPPIAPVGPWREVRLEQSPDQALADMSIRSRLDNGHGTVDVVCWLRDEDAHDVSGDLSVGDVVTPLIVERRAGGYRLSGQVRIRSPRLWWPHTHGTPYLYSCAVSIRADGHLIEPDCDPVGFRQLQVRNDERGFGLAINGCPVFCRGACWTTADIVSMNASPGQLSKDLGRLRDAGANMVRVGGTMVYEADAFYQLCDELGLLVWQDFMFANMDYPVEDEAFLRAVTTEATQQLRRLRTHPSVAVFCGNSEVEQQAAMLGVPKEAWRNRLFGDVLPALCSRQHPNAVYVPSTPSGGALPFHVGTGLAHYYGVGAYLRPLSDVRRADVKFTPECLGFANVPEPSVVDRIMEGDLPAMHDPRWKRGTPRDGGAGWDFDDVRDHYLHLVFGVDPAALRTRHPVRYLELSRVTSGEVMSQVFSEWRSVHSRCQGGLVWFLRDLQPGAGWGVLDSDGVPKACYYYLRRVWQPQAVAITDEGLDGLQIHVNNETAGPLDATLELTLLREGHVIAARTSCRVAPRGRATYGSDELFGAFSDITHAYRFGPPVHTVVAATLFNESGAVVSEAFWCPDMHDVASGRTFASSVVSAAARPSGRDWYDVALRSQEFLYAVRVDAEGYLPDDNYFCLMPGREKRVRMRPAGDTAPVFDGTVEALNLMAPAHIDVGPV